MDTDIFYGSIPALMTPCNEHGEPNYSALVSKAEALIEIGMKAVVYCGSMGDWPLLSDKQRQQGVAALVEAGVPVIVGTGAQNSASAAAHAAHAKEVGAHGLMVIPRVLSRATAPAAQKAHFAGILEAAVDLPSIIYNSPYYGFETKADLFFDLRRQYPHLIGFKEFGGAAALSYAAEHITNSDENLLLLIGVDTQVVHGIVNCGAVGVITGIGNVLPREVLRLVELSKKAATGDPKARRLAGELDQALNMLATFDEGPDLVLFFKYLLNLQGDKHYKYNIYATDQLSISQQRFAEAQLELFNAWWRGWEGNQHTTSKELP